MMFLDLTSWINPPGWSYPSFCSCAWTGFYVSYLFILLCRIVGLIRSNSFWGCSGDEALPFTAGRHNWSYNCVFVCFKGQACWTPDGNSSTGRSRTTIVKSLEHLYTLGALNDEGKLSAPLGFQMSRFPLEPLYAKAMLVSSEFGCSKEMLAAIAMLSVESLFYTPRDKIKEVILSCAERVLSLHSCNYLCVNDFSLCPPQ